MVPYPEGTWHARHYDQRMAMTEAQFREFWEALGNAVRIAVQPEPASTPEATPAQAPSGKTETPARDPGSTTSATAERAWSPVQRAPAPARSFGFGIPGDGQPQAQTT